MSDKLWMQVEAELDARITGGTAGVDIVDDVCALEAERDALRAEVERLKGEHADVAGLRGDYHSIRADAARQARKEALEWALNAVKDSDDGLSMDPSVAIRAELDKLET